MNKGIGQGVLMFLVAACVGVFILHMGIEMMQHPLAIGDVGDTSAIPENYAMGALLVGAGALLLGCGAKVMVNAIANALLPEAIEPEDVWEELSPSLQRRFHYTVTKGYSRVVVKDDDFQEMLRMEKQPHVKFVGKEGAVVELSSEMIKYISAIPESELPPKPQRTPKPEIPLVTDEFWNPQPVNNAVTEKMSLIQP